MKMFEKIRKFPKSSTWWGLFATAAGVTAVGCGGFLYSEHHYQKMIRKSPIYNEALYILDSHPRAKDALGTPIQLLDIDLSNGNENFCFPPEYCKFTIPLIGQNDVGSLHVRALGIKGSFNGDIGMEIAKLNLHLEGKDDLFTIYEIIDRQPEVETLEKLTYSQAKQLVEKKANRTGSSSESDGVRHIPNPQLRWIARKSET